MEALDNLSLENALRAEVCQHMLRTLNKAPPEFLPAIVGFLISSEEPSENLVEVSYKFVSSICNCNKLKYDIIKCCFSCVYIPY